MTNLERMGYRQLNSTSWAKPLGCNLLVIDLEQKVFSQFFKDMNGQVAVWNRTPLGEHSELTVKDIQDLETWNVRAAIGQCQIDGFDFLTREQEYSKLL